MQKNGSLEPIKIKDAIQNTKWVQDQIKFERKKWPTEYVTID